MYGMFIFVGLCGIFALSLCVVELVGFLCTFALYKLGNGKRGIRAYWKHWNNA